MSWLTVSKRPERVTLLADRTNGRASATVLRLSSRLWRYVGYCGWTVRPRAKVTIDTYRKSYIRHRLVSKWMTLTFVWRSFKVMSTIAASISSKLLELETSNLIRDFVLPLLFDCQVLHTSLLWGSTVGYPSDSLASCFIALRCASTGRSEYDAARQTDVFYKDFYIVKWNIDVFNGYCHK